MSKYFTYILFVMTYNIMFIFWDFLSQMMLMMMVTDYSIIFEELCLHTLKIIQ